MVDDSWPDRAGPVIQGSVFQGSGGRDETAGRTHRAWPTSHGGGYPPGWHVRYRSRAPRAGSGSGARTTPTWREHLGTVAGRSLRDEHTSTTWVPVRPRGATTDTPASLVRATDILDARPPAEERDRT